MLTEEQRDQIVACCRELVQVTSMAGCEQAVAMVPYGRDGSDSAEDLAIPSNIISPGAPRLFHGVDEYIAIDQLLSGAQLYLGRIDRVVRDA